jgi:hypothetical protein
VEPTEIAKSLDIQVVRNLLGPVTKEAGELLGDIGNIVRFYTQQNLMKVFKRWAIQRSGKPLYREEFVRAVPLLHAASLQSNEELQEQWAALLESSVTCPDSTLPSFGQALSQMTAEESRFLRDIYNQSPKVESRDMRRLIGIYQEATLNLDYLDKEKMKSAEQQAFLLVNDLLRLGLIDWHQEPGGRFREEGLVSHLEDRFSHSTYGAQFLNAVTPKLPRVP